MTRFGPKDTHLTPERTHTGSLKYWLVSFIPLKIFYQCE